MCSVAPQSYNLDSMQNAVTLSHGTNIPPTLTTQRLVLRPLVESDIPAIQRNFTDYELVRNLSSLVPWPYPADGASAWFHTHVVTNQGRDRWIWAITLRDNATELIGVVELWRKGCPENRGFWLSRGHWGKGYMTEAVIPVTDLAFDTLGFEKLILSNAVGNPRSARVKEKCGAHKIGELAATFVDPNFTTSELWELTKESWRAYRRQHLDSPD